MRPILTALLLCAFAPLSGLADQNPPAEPAPPAAESVAAAASEPAPAVPSAAASTGAEAKVAAAEDPIVCKSKSTTGTRFAKKSCLRQSEWDAITKKAEEDFATIRNRPVTCPDCRE